MSRYRRLRGVVRHLLPVVQRGRMHSRDALGYAFGSVRRGAAGTCRWCGLPTGFARRWWDPDCVLQYRAVRGESVQPPYPKVCEMCGGSAREIDHRIAISVARAEGARAYVRAFLLDNLRWLCRACHLLKTAEDRRRPVQDHRRTISGV